MAEQKYEHWRNLTDLTHLRAECFNPGEKKILTIKSVVSESLKNQNGTVEEKPVAYFEETGVLPMVLNVTNCKTIEALYKSGNIYDWIGKKIQIIATKTKVAGEFVPCLRIEKVIPTSDTPRYYCSICGREITQETYTKSINKYGKAYCSKECLEAETKGRNLL